MKKLISFTFDQPAGQNFTPSAKMYEYAKQNHYEISHRYFNTFIKIHGIEYTYHHYHIEPLTDGTEKVTIYLEEN